MSTTGAEPDRALAHHQWIWVSVIVGLLSLQVLMCSVAIVLATTDESMAIEPNFGEKSLRWDEARAAKQASEALGWTASVDIPAASDFYGHRTVRVTLLDRAGQAVADANVRMTLFHHAHASRAQQVVLASDGGGVYSAEVEMRHQGLWEFRIVAQRGSEVFQLTQERDIP